MVENRKELVELLRREVLCNVEYLEKEDLVKLIKLFMEVVESEEKVIKELLER